MPFLRVLLLVGLATVAARATADDLLLYSPFDGQVDAEVARGDARASSTCPPEYRPGVRGQALLVGGSPDALEEAVQGMPKGTEPGRNVTFASQGNLDIEQGTLSFWIKPLDWGGKSNGFNVLLRAQAGGNHFMLYKFYSREQLLFLRGAHEKWTSVTHRIGHWQPGQWRHVAVTWSPAEMRLFIDGALVCAERVRFPLEDAKPVDPLSIGPGGSWEKAFIGHSLIDELRIHARPLTHEEIGELYRKDAAGVKMDTGQLTVGFRAAQADGRIRDGEYTFIGTGFADLRGMYSPRQSIYGLSYDAKNLYLAVQSDLASADANESVPEGDVPDAGEQVQLLLAAHTEPDRVLHLSFSPDGRVRRVCQHGEPCDEDEIHAKNTIEDGTWTLETAIPFSVLGQSGPPQGQSWRINIARLFASPPLVTTIGPAVGSLTDYSKLLTLHFREDAPELQIRGLFDLARHCAAYDVSARPADSAADIRLVSISDTTGPYGLRTSQHELFSDGRSTPFRAPKPPGGWPLVDFALHEIRVLESLAGQEQTVYRARFMYERQMPMKTLFLYTLDQRQLSVTAQRRADGAIRARFLQADGSVAWQAQQPIAQDATIFDAVFDLDFERLVPGDYDLRIDYISPAGEATETYRQAYRVPGPDAPAYRTYVDPEADQVPAPWTPLESGESMVSMWGRRYDFSGGFLFSSLTSQGNELLAAPASLRHGDQTLSLQKPPEIHKVAATPLTAVWEKRADLGPLEVSSRIAVHFDGYCEVAMTLQASPAEDTPIQSLSLDIPLRGELAALVRDNRISPLTGGKSGAVGDYWCQKLIDNPMLWIGCEKAGFNWLASTLEGWHCRKHATNVEILRQGPVAVLRLNLIDSPVNLRDPRTIRFGFTLTPSRPLDRKINRCRLERDWEMWCQPWQYFAVPDYDTADRQMIEYRSRNVKEIFLYFGDGFISPFSPDWAFFEQQWRELHPRRTFGEWTGGDYTGPQRGRLGYTEGCIMSDSFRNYVNNTRAAFFERAKTPLAPKATSYYFDTAVVASQCSNPYHGCALWEAADGKRYGRIPLEQRREIALNAYRMIRRTGPEAKIMAHQGWTRAMPLQHFADVMLGGEGVEVGNTGNYFDLLTPEMFRATFCPYIWGMKMVFLDMTVRAMKENRPQRLLTFDLDDPVIRRALLHSYGYCVLHDVDLHDAASESRPLRETLWQAQDALGWDEHVEFHPYWKHDAVRVEHPSSDRVLASAYTKDGSMLLALLNDTDQEHEVGVRLDLDKLGVAGNARGVDVFEPEVTLALKPECTATLPPRSFRLFLVHPQ